eukprot:sb/3476796/
MTESFAPPFTSSVIPVITLVINTDGVEYTNSSSKSLYPVFIACNELPPALRAKLIMCPFLFTKTKEEKFDDRLLAVLVQELNSLHVDGVSYTTKLSSLTCHYCFITRSLVVGKR